MSATTVTKKRKSIGDSAPATKKIKTAKSEVKPAPLKSALKKPKDEVALKKTNAKEAPKAKKTETAAKVVKPRADAVVKEKKTKKPKPAAAEAAPEPAEDALAPTEVDDAGEGGAELTEDQTAALIAGFSSSEDEASEDEEAGIAISKLPKAPRIGDIQKTIKDAASKDPEQTPGVVYIGRIPHGFYEKQMRAYFSQFGEILHMRLARNHKTGKSQHYAFLEFKSGAVGEIVAKTMDKYLLFGHILQVRIVPREQVKENMWDGSGKRKKPAPRNRLEGSHLKRGLVKEDWEKKVGKENKKRSEKAEKLRELGYEFDMPVVKSVDEVDMGAGAIEEAQADEPKLLEASEPVPAAAEPVSEPEAAAAAAKKATKANSSKKRMSTDASTSTKKAKKVKT
ncbi:nucleolar protein [Recurvomyces mirabilis]|uniref:Nucleolar protein n=1 Tax=Recurvomyces mirabilis TaxID=574656 RepID=A0AAE1C0B0_9PEZI|nr:nucleolar protein [Recurvomyces mirabilis]KAK5152265.1 nucleolar protein [Recurvomyces mirabilis]